VMSGRLTGAAMYSEKYTSVGIVVLFCMYA
jgi:hypothetical protein